jgi:predicted transposase/invertase (TIGR01784 family)
MKFNFLDPKVDIAFKKIFASADHKNLTINFLNNILNLSGSKLIEEITFLETEKQPARLKGKKVYFDIYCIDKQKCHYIIEIQLLNEFNFIPRSEYYVARALALQLNKGKDYQDLLPVVFLGIVNYNLFDDLDDDQQQVISSYSMRNDITGKRLKNTRMSLHYIELPKFNKTLDQLETTADQWLYFLKHAKNFDTVPAQLAQLSQAFNILDQLKWSYSDLEEYSKEQEIIDREKRQQEGSKEKGREEEKEKTALKMLKKNMNIEDIIEITGLSIEYITKLAEVGIED